MMWVHPGQSDHGRMRPEKNDTPLNELYNVDLNNNRRTLSVRLFLNYISIELI